MVLPTPWYVVAGTATLMNGCVLGFIARRERSRALSSWACGWLAWAVAVVPLVWLDQHPTSKFAAASCGVAWGVSTLCLLHGSYAFAERKLPVGWYAVAFTCAPAAFILGIDPSEGLGMLPLLLFQSAGLGTAGVLTIRAGRHKAGAWLAGLALIGLALHLLDGPVFAANPDLMPWGFVVAILLELLAALGMVTFFYEHTRAQLLKAQQALSESRRVEALGRVAGGVAHDFNNVLTILQGHLDFLRVDLDKPDAALDSVQAMDDAVRQAARLTARLLAFGGGSAVQTETIDVRKVVEGTLDLLRTVIPARIEIRFSCAEADYTTSMDRALLEQVVLNLVTNSRDAITLDGHIDITLDCEQEPCPHFLLRVEDDGIGMDEQVLSHLFEPFFTTKEQGKGTGLGLASVQGAITQMGGSIAVSSKVGIGTAFEVRLPRRSAVAVVTQRHRPIPAGPLSILVVDDTDAVRIISARMLQSSGHKVDQAADGLEALELVRAHQYDVILSDVVMPRMGGLQLAEAIVRQRLDAIVVLTSGYPRDATLEHAVINFIPKPFQRKTLTEAIERLVVEKRSSAPPEPDVSADSRDELMQ